MRFCVIAKILGLLTIAAVTFSAERVTAAEVSSDEQRLWDLEHAYWRYVEESNLAAYSALWHQNFLGWPSISAAPVRKDHITDWITSQTNKGLTFKTDEFKRAAIQVTGDVASVGYWITFRWLDKDGNGAPHTLRITHTWLRTGNDWRILAGMSMPEPGGETSDVRRQRSQVRCQRFATANPSIGGSDVRGQAALGVPLWSHQATQRR